MSRWQPRREEPSSLAGGDLWRDRWFSSRPVSHSPIFCGRTWNSFLKETQRPPKDAFPWDAIRRIHDHPHDTFFASESVRRRARTSPRALLFLPFFSSFTHGIPWYLISDSKSRAWMTKWNRSEMKRPSACHSRSYVTSHSPVYARDSRKAGRLWQFPATGRGRCRWLSWLKPFWLSCGCNYTERTECSHWMTRQRSGECAG